MAFVKNDYFIAACIFLVALALRVPFLSHPPSIVFDEGLNANFTIKAANSEPFFDVHPPLAILVFESVAGLKPFSVKKAGSIGSGFADFPYVMIRVFNAILGSLLVVCVYIIARLLYRKRIYALVPAFLVTFDNALVLYSRLILPDTVLLFTGFLGVALVLAAKNSGISACRYAFLISSGVLFGFAASVKWSGLGFLAVAAFLLLKDKRFGRFVAISLIALLTYLAVSVIFYSQFPARKPDTFNFSSPYVTSLEFPDGNDIRAVISFLPRYTLAMFRGNYDVVGNPGSSRPYMWPFGQSVLGFWSDDNAEIELVGNFIGWTAVTVSVILTIVLLLFSRIYRRFWKFSAGDPEKLLIFAYLINFVPFFFIWRSLFLYHYFAALIFGYLLVPLAVPVFVDIFNLNRRSTKIIISAFILLELVSFSVLVPGTYGL